jgi:hypothetical protein
MISSGIETVTFRPVEQCFNQRRYSLRSTNEHSFGVCSVTDGTCIEYVWGVPILFSSVFPIVSVTGKYISSLPLKYLITVLYEYLIKEAILEMNENTDGWAMNENTDV